MKKTIVIMAVFLGFAGALSAAANDNGIIIFGDVSDANGKIMKDVKVKVTNVCLAKSEEIKTSATSGEFTFNGDYCNTYVVEALAEGYTGTAQIVEVNADHVINVKLKLTPKKAEAPVNKAVESGIRERSYGATGFETPFTS